MISQRMMVGQGGKYDTWTFTINTEATSVGEKKTGIPLNLYNQGTVFVDVDWGDGTTDTLTPSDYTVNSSLASVHEYESAGIYTITLGSSTFSDTRFLYVDVGNINNNVSLTDATAPIYYMQRTLVSIDSPIVQTLGVNYVYGASGTSITDVYDNSFRRLFFRCSKLTSVPQNFFSKASSVTDTYLMFCKCTGLTTLPADFLSGAVSINNVHYLFFGCTAINDIPSSLFYNLLDLENMYGTFSNCSTIGDFDITISSTKVDQAGDFIPFKNGANRIIRVPSGSTTETTFNSIASSCGLTIIGE